MLPTMRIGFDVTVTARARTGVGVAARHLEATLRARGLDVRPWQGDLGPGRSGLARLANALRLARWLVRDVPRRVRQERVTVYHAPTSLGPLRAGCPTVLTVHDATLFTRPAPGSRADRLYFLVFSRVAARRAAAVIVASRAARDAVARAYRLRPEGLHVVPHGVAERFRPLSPEARAPVLARHDLRGPYVLFVGARPPRKNLPRLVEALARLRREPDAAALELVVVGPPEPEDPAARATVERLGLTSRVRWLDWVPDEDLPALYGGARCLAYPSHEEGFGLPVLEAMACGTSVLTSDGSSMAEVAGPAALLVDPGSIDALAEGLRRLLRDAALRAELGARGLARAAPFTWARSAELTEAIYRRVASA